MSRIPKWFVPVAVIALLWNLLGCAAYLMDVMLTSEDVAKLGAAEQAMYAARPAWAVAATATAVWFGAIGCLGLVLRRRWAMPVLVLSLLGVIVQDVAIFAMMRGVTIPAAAYAMQGLVLLIAIALVWMARTGATRGWLR
ncbi:hypothetical protein [Oleiagrimonas soli]|uniref:Sugar transporter n=1 Tax=Oleiagrimonas soli TaxID=1543381 RepID=A0A099CV24_9GAMM|nr:hypothetical protein [Oleiagrimonas soli]KGI76875.1 hypothetical protein LF63_0113190 [Oleiagrimonas soli]MBB6185268.1 hypothetical protein [Oleiagrimonas soli]